MRKIILGILIVVLLFCGHLVVLSITRAGETKVSVTIIPDGGTIKLGGKVVSNGSTNLYLRPGTYTLTGSAEGWGTDSKRIKVENETIKTGLVPPPQSEAAKEWLSNNPDIQLARERIGGEEATRASQQLLDQNPVIDLLPYSDPSGPFAIDYGLSQTRPGKVYLVVSDSSPNGRVNALKWLREQGYDPTDFEIIYSDFVSPLGRPKNDGGH